MRATGETPGASVTFMTLRLNGRLLGVAIAVLLLAAAPETVWGQARPKINGKVEVGALVTASFSGKASAFRWESCARVSSPTCTSVRRIGSGRTLTVPSSALGLQVRVSVRVRKRWIASAWSGAVSGLPSSLGSTTTPAPSSAPPPAPIPAPIPIPGDSRSNPVPLGQQAGLYDSWAMSVVSYSPDATAAVLAENMFNDPPAAGKQFAIVRVRATYTGASSDSFGGSFRLRAVGSSNVSHSTFANYCGVIPDEISSATLFPGGTIEGNVCFEVTAADASSLMLYDDGSFRSIDRRWFSLF